MYMSFHRKDVLKTFWQRFQNVFLPMNHYSLVPFERIHLYDQVIYKISVYQRKSGKTVWFLLFFVERLDFETAKNFMLRASSGILKQRHDSKYESASFCVHILYLIYVKELSLLVFSSSPYEELFIRRNSLLRILHRYLCFF